MKAVLVAAFLLAAPPALACSCMRGPDAPLPPVVLEARVLAVSETARGVTARLQVLRVERGRAARRITVRTPPHSAACGVAFRRGDVNRFGLSAGSGSVHTANLCQQIMLSRPQ